MKLVATLDEYLLTKEESIELILYLQKNNFKVYPNFPNRFLNADSILDRNGNCSDLIDCGAIVHHPWGGAENKGLIIYRDTRLEVIIKKYNPKIVKKD